MDLSRAHKRGVIVLMTLAGLTLFWLAAGWLTPDSGPAMAPVRTPRPAKFFLERGQPVTIGHRIFCYQGCRGDQIRLDVILPELDRTYAYPFQVDIHEFRRGTTVAGVRLQLIAVRPHFINVRADG